MVAGLTAAALAAVGFLAYQASANAPDTLGKPGTPSHAPPRPVPRAEAKDPLAVPADSGTGARVVYALQRPPRVAGGAEGQAEADLRGHAERR